MKKYLLINNLRRKIGFPRFSRHSDSIIESPDL